MIKVKVYNQKAEKIDDIQLSDKVFNVKTNLDLVHQAVLSQMGNIRQVLAHTKDRSEVRGGGRKPWRQKGTGRARVGSSRSPIWRSGGVTFGPTNRRNFARRINRKQRVLVIGQLILNKVEEGNVKILDDIKFESGKTKEIISLLASLAIDGNALIIVDDEFAATEDGNKLFLASRNISFVHVINVKKINAHMLLKYKWLILTKKAFESIKDSLVIFEKAK